MKTIYLLLFSLMCTHLYSQELELNKQEMRELKRFGIIVQDYDLANGEVVADFKTILELERKRKKSKTRGIVSASVSGFLLVVGSIVLILGTRSEAPREEVEMGPDGEVITRHRRGGDLGQVFAALWGGAATGAGVLGAVPTALHFKWARHLKNERDKLISKYLDPSL